MDEEIFESDYDKLQDCIEMETNSIAKRTLYGLLNLIC